MDIIEVLSMGLSTDHLPGEKLSDPGKRSYYVILQMLTPGLVSTNDGVKRIEPYECILYLPNTPRVLLPIDESSSFRNNWMYFQGDAIGLLIDHYALTPGQIYHTNGVYGISECFRMLFSEFILPGGQNSELTKLIIQQLLVYLSRANQAKRSDLSAAFSYKEQLTQIRFDIYQDVRQEWDVGTFAKKLGVSSTWFAKLYRARFGISPKRDILRARIECAKGLLAYTDYPLKEIAILSGFQNEYYFSSVFKSFEDTPPGRYRRLNGNK